MRPTYNYNRIFYILVPAKFFPRIAKPLTFNEARRQTARAAHVFKPQSEKMVC